MKVYLLRHAESESNAQGLLTSTEDEKLTVKGLLQAESIVPELKKLQISKVVCSSFLRARQTIRPFIEQTELDVEYSDVLVEGQLVLDEQIAELNVNYENVAETESEFIGRAKQAVNFLRSQKVDNLLVVTHGHMIREIINLLLDLPSKIRFPHENCGLSLIELGDSVKVQYLNRTVCSNKSVLGT